MKSMTIASPPTYSGQGILGCRDNWRYILED